ncbi:opaque-specific ABC transporter CDR3 [Verticillium dahliae VdLs.17]|uniref:Opaque-specific ABC transporter CDR3 n=1 Tax=Verticillium dahliae (strain VdLs.17 / ATCC MYA-4575 / FGSC 10137) TaxID=498257 RepID=G2XHT1_VERDV|nr:opaque-specific ABC transporter CDR3 [Verticillium dahliae VdLs.17]EGY19379.1 opaque-specific ABC transporter CDR3 [Verticillium dahliae VdLs.17]
MHELTPGSGSRLDPASASFDGRAWVKAFLQLAKSDSRTAPMRVLGVAFKSLNVFGWSTGTESQMTVTTRITSLFQSIAQLATGNKQKRRMDILRDFEGIVAEGELLLVLGPPGSGCSTLLKTLAGETSGLQVAPGSYINFRGIPSRQIRSSLRGDVLYNAEVDTHLAHLTVGETLSFAARARSVRNVPSGLSRTQADGMIRDVIMAVFGIAHTINTRVGNDFVRGVSGGERKRVSIAEAALTGAKFQCWDNSTRGLDSANAVTFCRNLRVQSDLLGVAAAVAIYQAPQSAYDLFHRVTVLRLMDMKDYTQNKNGLRSTKLRAAPSKPDPSVPAQPISAPSDHKRADSGRGWNRLLADPYFTIAQLFFNLIMALILGSMFYNLKEDTSSFYYRGGIIFFALLLNAFASQLEVLTVYEERSIVEKHNRYAFYHQSTQAIASYLMDLPYKMVNMFIFNLIVYFMANLRRDPGPFFFFCLTSFIVTLIMSSLYRTLACVTRTSHQAMVPSAILSIGLMVYTGFTIPTMYMRGWSRWMNYINPLAYGFEALMANEFHDMEFPCEGIIPYGTGYDILPSDSTVCPVVGALPGSGTVQGDRYINMAFAYYHGNKWRNIGILITFLIFFLSAYTTAAEFAKPPKSKGEVLVFPKGKLPSESTKTAAGDLEGQPIGQTAVSQKPASDRSAPTLVTGTAVFHWENLSYDIKIKGEDRRILDQVDGWVKPGTSTALMGVSGAGKTTLLDVLATRVTMGVVTGDTLINGIPTDSSFQHRVGYVQQQDLHLSTATVREALSFSAILRQSAEIPYSEKLAYVDQVIDMLDMQAFADAVIGVPGEGLNVEQRKRLTIGVELAARPQLLLFLDEPTSGLDSQTSWSIIQLIKKLTRSGQAVLCTIHQPSAILFGEFDRLLLLAPGGKTVYFGELGDSSKTLIEYMERGGAPKCPAEANPAEWMLNVIKPSTDASFSIDWHRMWRNSPEFEAVKRELNRLRALEKTMPTPNEDNESQHREFVTSFQTQFWQVFVRTHRHFWRSPTYIWSKILMISISSIYLGFSFRAANTMQGLQNQLFAIFMFLVLFGNLNEQIMPMFVPQRDLFEIRERPSKIYRWDKAAWNTLMAVIIFVCWYYPVGFVMNTSPGDEHSRGLLVFFFLWMFMLFTSTFSHFSITWIPTADTAGVFASLLWMLCLCFCGVGVAKSDLPTFWTFMYYISPGTYLVGGVMSSAIANAEVTCAASEILRLAPPSGMDCLEFLGAFAEAAGGNLLTPNATETCLYCPISNTNQFLARYSIKYATRWRDFGVLWAYILFNVSAALALYWAFRMPKGKGTKRG